MTQDNRQKIVEAIRNHADSLSLHKGVGEDRLPGEILDMPDLRHLRIEGFYDPLPAWLADLVHLETLDLEETGSVAALAPLLGRLTQLQKLRLAFVSDLTEIPASWAQLRHLKELNIDGSDIEEISPALASLTSLESFSYEYCYMDLPELFDTLSSLPRLKRLRLTHVPEEFAENEKGQGDFLPESFCRLHSLEELDFTNWNSLRELPACIGRLQNLRRLILSNDDHELDFPADLRELPDAVCDLKSLEVLDLFGLQDLKRLPEPFFRLSRLKDLDIRCSGIEELHLTAEQWGHLERLKMQGPLPDFRQCPNLKEFAWYINRVSVGPGGDVRSTDGVISLPGLTALGNLEELRISGGTLEDTSFLSALPRLRRLSLSCDFERFPPGFERLDKLEELFLWGAKSLEALPEGLGNMPSLRRIDLACCGVRQLPESVRRRKDLIVRIHASLVQEPQ